MQTLFLDDFAQIRNSSAIILVNPRAQHQKVQVTSQTTHKALDIPPCASVKLQIHDGSALRVLCDKEFHFAYRDAIPSTAWHRDQVLSQFFEVLTSAQNLTRKLQFPAHTSFRGDVDALRDLRINAIIQEIRDADFQHGFAKMMQNLHKTYGFLPQKTTNDIFAHEFCNILTSHEIKGPQHFTFGRTYKSAIFRAILTVICHSFDDFPDTEPLKPLRQEHLLQFVSKRCLLEARRAVPTQFELALRGDLQSIRKVLSEAILASLYRKWRGQQLFCYYPDDEALNLAFQQYQLKSELAQYVFRRPFLIDAEAEVLVVNALLEKQLLPTEDEICVQAQLSDIDIAICVLVLKIQAESQFKHENSRQVQLVQPAAQVARKANMVVLGAILRIEKAARAWMRAKHKGVFFRQPNEPQVSEQVEQHAEEVLYFSESYVKHSVGLAANTMSRSQIGQQMVLEKEISLLQRRSRAILNDSDAEISEIANMAHFDSTSEASGNESDAIDQAKPTNSEKDSKSYSEIVNRLPSSSDSSESSQQQDQQRAEYSAILNAGIIENGRSTSSNDAESDDRENEYSQILNRHPFNDGNGDDGEVDQDQNEQLEQRDAYSDILNHFPEQSSLENSENSDATEQQINALLQAAQIVGDPVRSQAADQLNLSFSASSTADAASKHSEASEDYSAIANRLYEPSTDAQANQLIKSHRSASDDAPGVSIPYGHEIMKAVLRIQTCYRAISQCKTLSRQNATVFKEAFPLMRQYCISTGLLHVYVEEKSASKATYRILKSWAVILRALLLHASRCAEANEFRRRRRASVRIQACVRARQAGWDAVVQLSACATTVQRFYRGMEVRRCLRWAKAEGLLAFCFPDMPLTAFQCQQLRLRVVNAQRRIVRAFKAAQAIKISKMHQNIAEELGVATNAAFERFLGRFRPSSLAQTLQLLELYLAAASQIARAFRRALARRSRAALITVQCKPNVQSDFLRPKTIALHSLAAEAAATSIQRAARCRLLLLSKSVAGEAFFAVFGSTHNLSFSRAFLAARAIFPATAVIQRAARHFLRICVDDLVFSCKSRQTKMTEAAGYIQSAFHAYICDKHAISRSGKAILHTRMPALQPEREKCLQAVRLLQFAVLRLYLMRFRNLTTLRTFASASGEFLRFHGDRYESQELAARAEGKGNLKNQSCHGCRAHILARFVRFCAAASKIQAFCKTKAFLEKQKEDQVVRQAQQIFSRIRFYQENPSVSLGLHARILSTTDVPERHRRSLTKLQTLQLPYHAQLMSALIKCTLSTESRELAFAVLQRYLPVYFTAHMRVQNDIFQVIDAAIECKTVESARFLKNMAKVLPMSVVGKVRAVIQWRKGEQNEDVRRLLKGVIYYCGS